MTKIPKFERKKRDFYATIDPKAFETIAPHIEGKTYAEPCAGHGDLIKGILEYSNNSGIKTPECLFAMDFHLSDFIVMEGTHGDAMNLHKDYPVFKDCDLIVTNPPFSKELLLPLLEHFVTLKPTWLLLPAARLCTGYFQPYLKKCTKVVPIGRLCWFPVNGKMVKGTEDFAWYFFPQQTVNDDVGPCVFIPKEGK